MLCPLALFSQTTVTIGDETSSWDEEYPINRRYNNYSSSEIIYWQSEINTDGAITKIAFYKTSGTNTEAHPNITIYMKHTTDDTFSSGIPSLSGYTKVFEGNFTNSSTSGWMEVNLDTPFEYNNTDNLQVAVINNSGSSLDGAGPKYRRTHYDNSQRHRRHAQSSQYSWTEQEHTAVTQRPNVRLIIDDTHEPPVDPETYWNLTGNEIEAGQFIGTTNEQPLIFKANGIEGFRLVPNSYLDFGNTDININGNVGIGTNEPAAKFEISGSTFGAENPLMRITKTGFHGPPPCSGDGPSIFEISKKSASNEYYPVFVVADSGNIGIRVEEPLANFHVNGDSYFDGPVKFEDFKNGFISVNEEGEIEVKSFDESLFWSKTEEDEHIYNINEGNVGIGTNNPQKKLHVKQYKTLDQTITLYPTIRTMEFDTTFMQMPIDERDSILLDAEHRGSLRLELDFEGVPSIWDIQPAGTNIPDQSSLNFVNISNNSTAMRIRHNNAVGIGTLSPAGRLHVHNGNFVVTEGKVGIGTTGLTYTDKLHIKGGSNLIQLERDNIPQKYRLAISNTGRFSIAHIGEGERISIDADGNVGIGTDNPNAKLDIVGVLSTGNKLINLQQGYEIWSDNTGSGIGGLTRLWFQAPNNGSMVLGPRETANKLNNIRFRAELSRFEGTVRACQVEVVTGTWCDFVFEPDYNLMPLADLESFIKANKHLPEVPPEREIIENGLDLGEMQKLQMMKIEELTLYIIDLQKQINDLKSELEKTEANN